MSLCGGVLWLLGLAALGRTANPLYSSPTIGHPLEGESSHHPPVSFNYTDTMFSDRAPQDDEVVGECFLQDLPSAPCLLRCLWRGRTAHCGQDSSCFCKDWPEPTVNTSQPSPHSSLNKTDSYLPGYCFFGNFPSATCSFRCFWRGQSAFCDREHNCWCKEHDESMKVGQGNPTEPPTIQEDHDSTLGQTVTEEDSEGTSPPVVLYIIHLFGPEKNGSASEVSKDTSHGGWGLWSIPHILAATVLVLFVVLVAAECVLLLSRRRGLSKPPMQTILTPPTKDGE